jgi:hypothetical protein
VSQHESFRDLVTGDESVDCSPVPCPLTIARGCHHDHPLPGGQRNQKLSRQYISIRTSLGRRQPLPERLRIRGVAAVCQIELAVLGDRSRPIVAAPNNLHQTARRQRICGRLVGEVRPHTLGAAIADPLQDPDLACRQWFISTHAIQPGRTAGITSGSQLHGDLWGMSYVAWVVSCPLDLKSAAQHDLWSPNLGIARGCPSGLPLLRLARCLRRTARQTHPHPPLPTSDQRKDRAISPNDG